MTINVSITAEFALRPLFFVHEDQEQIIFLLVETFTYLSVAESFKKKSQTVARVAVWEKIDALMTDPSAKKN